MRAIPKFIIYKIYNNDLVQYVGRTKQPLKARLRGHFFKLTMHKPIDIAMVTKIEFAECKTEADMFLYEIYYINKFKPVLNRDDKAPDNLTIEMPELTFEGFDVTQPLFLKWKCKLIKNR